MKKNNFEQHANMQQAFLHLDEDRSGFIDKEKLMKTLTDNFNLQVPGHVIDKVFKRIYFGIYFLSGEISLGLPRYYFNGSTIITP